MLSKIVSEIFANFYINNSDMKIMILRCGNIYGPGDCLQPGRMRFIPLLFQKMLNDEKIVLTDGNLKKRFLYIEDFLNIMTDLFQKSVYNYPVNILSKRSISLLELANLVGKICGKEAEVEIGHIGKRSKKKFDYSRKLLKSKLGNIAETKLEEGLFETYKYIINNSLK
jgi:nucleoside-diphosphate-sugar epimerase